ncbi:MAG: DUF1385 domain-containing protein [Rhizobacter sp.]|nr:DUF1385 domain-containing protein [Chlorobiales bacterium]
MTNPLRKSLTSAMYFYCNLDAAMETAVETDIENAVEDDLAVQPDDATGVGNQMRYNFKEPLQVGGQAVVEGVMMRAPQQVAVAVRKLDGSIKTHIEPFKSVLETHQWLRIPVVRGAVGLLEMMYLGIKMMNWSANETLADYGARRKEKTDAGITCSMIASIAVGVMFFFILPMWIATAFVGDAGSAALFNLVSGVIRALLFLGYLTGISQLDDVRRMFQYHGSEHKSIYAFEQHRPLTVNEAMKFTTLHPRCGTSFLLVVMTVSVFAFSFLDMVIVEKFGHINLVMRVLFHLPFIPLVGGLSYEVIKVAARYSESAIGKVLVAPGLWLQRITTREPDEEQLEVALASLTAALGTNRHG